MANQFNSVFNRLPKRNHFNLSFENKGTCPIGKLIPVMCQDVLPGDKFNIKVANLIRLQPMLAPIMQRIDVYFHAFFVPNRIIWKDWETFITGGEDGLAQVEKPKIRFVEGSTTSETLGTGTIYDYLNFPTLQQMRNSDLTDTPEFDALPFRAYAQIYNDYYIDQNLTGFIPIDDIGKTFVKDNDTDNYVPYALSPHLLDRCYKKDYFTSALPEPQRGPEVTIPIDGNVTFKANPYGNNPPYIETPIRNQDGSIYTNGNFDRIATIEAGNSATTLEFPDKDGNNRPSQPLLIDNSANLKVENANSTITDLRRAFKVQEWFEKMSRGGARYVEQILNFFGVRSSDARLQRAEYLGGCSNPLNIGTVLQTSQTTESSPMANYAGTGATASNNIICNKSFEEHGWIMVIMSIIPKSAYFQGLPRKYWKNDKTDYYWPQFAHIGEQEILNQELFYDFDNSQPNLNGFGYSPRYAEYRFNNDEIHGDFRDNLEFWHMARKFGSTPPLNGHFMSVRNEDVNRVFPVEQDKAHPILYQLFFDINTSRLISRYGNPRL